MDRGSISIVHLVELIDKAHTFISEHESSSLEDKLLRNWVSVDTGCQTDGTCSLTGSIDNSWENLLDILQKLRLGSSWVSEEKHVDISSDSMLSSDILWHTSEHGEGEALLNEVMAVDTWGDGVEDLFGDSWLLAELFDLMLIFVGKLDNLLITESSNVVCFDNSCENWETMLHICTIVKLVDEDSSDLYLISWPCRVYEIIEDKDLLLSWNTTWWHRAWGLLNGPFLVVSVHRFVILEVVWTLRLADYALPKELLLLFGIVVEKWAFQVLALLASEVHLLKLWENSCSLGDHSSDLNERIKMNLSQVSELVFHWEILYPHEDLVMDLVIVWVHLNNNVDGHLVDDLEHQLWLLSQPNGESWILGTQVIEDNFETLLIILAHFMDLLLVEIGSFLGLEVSDEVFELPFDISDDLLLLQPHK